MNELYYAICILVIFNSLNIQGWCQTSQISPSSLSLYIIVLKGELFNYLLVVFYGISVIQDPLNRIQVCLRYFIISDFTSIFIMQYKN